MFKVGDYVIEKTQDYPIRWIVLEVLKDDVVKVASVGFNNQVKTLRDANRLKLDTELVSREKLIEELENHKQHSGAWNKRPKKKAKRAKLSTNNRVERLMPEGVPRYIRCYDNGGRSADRYTIVFTGRLQFHGERVYVAMDNYPKHPQGFCQTGFVKGFVDRPSYIHLGKKVSFESLPLRCQETVIEMYKAFWNIEGETDAKQ